MNMQQTNFRWHIMHFAIALPATILIPTLLILAAAAQEPQDDPPGRVARLAYLQGAVSFQPAGESEWLEAIPNRPLTIGDRLWADKDSRVELSLGSAVIFLNSNTDVSFLNLDDRTVQVRLSSGVVNVHVRRLNRDDVFEIDTPNQAFSIYQPGHYRIEASEDGTYTVVSIREGDGESTGNGQTYALRAGQRATFEGTNALNAQVEDLGSADDFDNWSYGRERRYESSRSARYVSQEMVGYEDLDDSGDWRPAATYGNVWFPRVSAGWAPYREGHWAWIDPWGWTWVDDEPWGYAPFHYGRWAFFDGKWGWVPGPTEAVPVYAPALVVFVGGESGGFGENVGWFPLAPQEVYVPSYPVSREYVNRVNITNTTVTTTTVTNVYNTTIVNNNTTITNVKYVNRSISGAVTAVPQHAFVSAQPVARSVVQISSSELAATPARSRASVAPTANSVLGARAITANHVAAPPPTIANRPVVAKAVAPAPPVSFAARQQALAAHPGAPLARTEVQRLGTTSASASHPPVKQAPPGKPATPTIAHSNSAPATAPSHASNPPSSNAPQPNRPTSDNRTEPNQLPRNPPAASNRTAEPPQQTDRSPSAQANRPPEPGARNNPVPSAERNQSSVQNQQQANAPSSRPESSVAPPNAVHAKDLPPHPRSAAPNTGDPKLDQKFQQQQEQLYAKQQQEHQKLQQKQEQDHQRLAQQKADEAKMQQAEQKHQQQTQQLEQKHAQQQQNLTSKQQPANRNQANPPQEKP